MAVDTFTYDLRLALLALFGLALVNLAVFVWFAWIGRNRSAEADEALVQSHVDIVETPIDWQERKWA